MLDCEESSDEIRHRAAGKFLRDLNKFPPEELKDWLDGVRDEDLTELLACLERHLEHDETLISANLLLLHVALLDWKRLSKREDLLLRVYNFVTFLHARHPQAIGLLMELNFGESLVEVLKRESETVGIAGVERKVTACHVMSVFFPAIRDDAMDGHEGQIFQSGPRDERMSDAPKRFLDLAFVEVFKVCLRPDCTNIYLALLLKMVVCMNPGCVKDYVTDVEVATFIKVMVTSNWAVKAKAGLLMTEIQMGCEGFLSLHREDLHLTLIEAYPALSQSFKDGDGLWLREICASLVIFILDDDDEAGREFGRLVEGYSSIRDLESRIETISSTVDAVLRDFEHCNVHDDDALEHHLALMNRIGNLMPGMENWRDWREWDGRFETLVAGIVQVLDAVQARRGFFECRADMYDEEAVSKEVICVGEVNAGMNYLPSVNRATGPSKVPEELRRNSFVKILRFLSILYAVNEHWSVMLGLEVSDPLVRRSCFVSRVLASFVSSLRAKRAREGMNPCPTMLVEIARQYPFLLPFEERQFLLSLLLEEKFATCKETPFDVPRKRLIEYVAENLYDFGCLRKNLWTFTFNDEAAVGRGPTKEFYTVFSRDCQRHDLEVWTGEPSDAVEADGARYAVPAGDGLFPSPEQFSLTYEKMDLLKALGMVMAKSLVDGGRMDLNFGEPFYRLLFKSPLYFQNVSVRDLKKVEPNLYGFVRDLSMASKVKRKIEAEHLLTVEEKREIISTITCGGTAFEDLCIPFTLPGFPDVEMIYRGKDVLLTIDNVEEFLQNVLWWLMHYGPRQKIQLIREGFARIIPVDYMALFYPHEFHSLFCGIAETAWTARSLGQDCNLMDGLSLETPTVRYLFEILTSFSSENQKRFLYFATSSPLLPVGGLAHLSPRLSIRRQRTIGNPDDYLPQARTCFNELHVADYSSKEILEKKLTLAITLGSGSFQFA